MMILWAQAQASPQISNFGFLEDCLVAAQWLVFWINCYEDGYQDFWCFWWLKWWWSWDAAKKYGLSNWRFIRIQGSLAKFSLTDCNFKTARNCKKRWDKSCKLVLYCKINTKILITRKESCKSTTTKVAKWCLTAKRWKMWGKCKLGKRRRGLHLHSQED